MSKVAIHQPNFLPRLKVLQKICYADKWIVLSGVQFSRSAWQNRCEILTAHGNNRTMQLTLPVTLPKGRDSIINSVVIANWDSVLARAGTSLRHALRKAPYWSEVEDYWQEMIGQITSGHLADICIPGMLIALRRYARLPEVIMDSEVNATGKKSKLMASLCQQAQGTQYIADSGSLRYLDPLDFNAKVVWQHWTEPTTSKTSIKFRNLSFLNYLAYFGGDALGAHLLNGVFADSPPEVWPTH